MVRQGRAGGTRAAACLPPSCRTGPSPPNPSSPIRTPTLPGEEGLPSFSGGVSKPFSVHLPPLPEGREYGWERRAGVVRAPQLARFPLEIPALCEPGESG